MEPDAMNPQKLRVFLTQRATVDQIGRASLPLVIIVLFSLTQGIRFGFATSDYLFLLLASMISGSAMFFFGLLEIHKAMGEEKRPWMFFAALGGFVPYLFSLYLIGVRGIWSLTQLRQGASVSLIVASVSFVLLGYWFLRAYWRLTEIRAENFDASIEAIASAAGIATSRHAFASRSRAG
jgi:hypothetical protein